MANAADFRPVNNVSRVDQARLSPIPGHVSVVSIGLDWTYGQSVYDWSPVTGPSLIGYIPATSQGNWVLGLSGDGHTVIGKDRYGGAVAFRWTLLGGRQTLGTLPGGNVESVAYGVSADGSVIAGFGARPVIGGYMPIRWTEATGMQALGYLPGFTYSGAAEGVSANGQFLVGSSGSDPSTGAAFRWDTSNGLIAVGDLPGGRVNGRALAVSDDGAVVTGVSTSASLSSEAFRWTAATGIVGLGTLAGGYSSKGTHVSGDGGTILGSTSQGAFIWTAADGMRKLRDVLLSLGAINLSGWSLDEILDVSHDGTRILGRGNHGIFLADLGALPVAAPADAVDDGVFTAVEDTPIVLYVGGNDQYFTDPVTITVTTPPTKGTIAAISPAGPAAAMTITYVADLGATGPDNFVYSVADAVGAVDTAIVDVDIVPQDAIPDAFSFTDQVDVPRNADIESDRVTIVGFTVPVEISIVGGEYSVDYGEFTALPGTLPYWSQVAVRHTSAATALTDTSTVLTVGGVSATFTSTTEAAGPDADGDGIPDSEDNCTLVANPIQCDSDEDGYGNQCDGDFTNNGVTNAQDMILLRNLLGAGTPGPTYNVGDLNCNGVVNAQDATLLRLMLGQPPGPSGLVGE